MLQLSTISMAAFWPAYLVLDSCRIVLDCGPSLLSHYGPDLKGRPAEDFLGISLDQIWEKSASAGEAFLARPVKGPALRGIAIPSADNGRVLLMTFDVASLREAIRLGVKAQDLCIPMGQHDQLLNIALRDALLNDLKRSSDELAHTRDMLEKSIQSKSQLTSYLCHDFTNLLSVIAFDATRISKAVSRRERDEIVKNITLAATLGAHVSKTLTQLNAPKTAKCFHVDLWILENLNFLRSATRELALRTELSAQGELIEADPSEFIFCILNLLINAREATSNGTTITISTTCEMRGAKRMLNFSIIDEGHGISVGNASTLKSTKGDDRGLGVLAVSTFCSRYKGEFFIQYIPGVGTKASMLLPLHTDMS